jgi:hypothetical protein
MTITSTKWREYLPENDEAETPIVISERTHQFGDRVYRLRDILLPNGIQTEHARLDSSGNVTWHVHREGAQFTELQPFAVIFAP